MPTVYYTYYTPISQAPSDIAKQEHTLGLKLLSAGLENLFHISVPCTESDSVLKHDIHGKPYLPEHPEIHFNITHCDQFAACAFHNKPIGIDAELPGYFPEVLINRTLSENEKCFFLSKNASSNERQEWFYRFWTLKEAYVKKSGIGVDIDLTKFSFSFRNTETDFSITCSDSSVSCYQFKLSHGQILSLCCENGAEDIRLIPHSLLHVPQK